MAHQCPSGLQWDPLLNHCIAGHYLQPGKPMAGNSPVHPPVVHPTTMSPPESVPVISVSVWVCVAIVMSGSLLVLLLFFTVYRRHANHPLRTADKEAQPCEPAAMATPVGTPAVVVVNEDPNPSSGCSQHNGGTGELWQGRGTWRGGTGFGSLHMCNGRTEGATPLPATELGDAALVTTKTVQCSY